MYIPKILLIKRKEYIEKIKNLDKKTKKIVLLIGIFLVVITTIILVFPKNFKKTLVLNTNKSVYSVGENVYLSIVNTEQDGSIICDSKLKIRIKGPKTKIDLSTEDETISISTTCSEQTSNNPDYLTSFIPEKEGTYKITLSRGGSKVEKKIEVKDNQDFIIERSGATRVKKLENTRYPMIIKITSQKDFSGQISDHIPSSFNIIWQGRSTVSEEKNFKKITWNVELKAGETKELIYEYRPSEEISEVFKFGPIEILSNRKSIFKENAFWEVAVTK
ncbi:hypothetical protein ACFLZ4_00900 [Patescibacteria group bacterium]